MKKCTKCQNPAQDDDKFCSNCGNNTSAFDMQNKKPSVIIPDQSSLVSEDISCPKCGSKNIHIGRKGYGGGKALLGTIFLGPVGLLPKLW
jgi:predicted nucleic-acid-binding Zn-ribbon protein